MPDTIDETKKYLPWLVAVAFFMEALDTTILNTAVPIMAAALKVAPLNMKSVLSSYTLSLAVFIPISSWMADKFGTRKVFSYAIALFTLGSLFCGLSKDIHWLVVSRIIQGFGGAMMVPVGRLTLVRSFAKSELVRAMGFVAIPALIGPMLGPLAGGLIVYYFNWQVIFFLNLPIGILGFYFVLKSLPDFKTESVPILDIIGLIFFGTGIALLSYVLEVFGDHTLSGRETLSLFIISVSLIIGYLLHAAKIPDPLLKLEMFAIRTFRIAIAGNFATRLAAGGMPFLLPLLYQIGLGFSPIQSGFFLMPQSVAALILRMNTEKILNRYGYRKILLYNTAAMGLIIALFGTISNHTPMWVIVLQACAFGFISSLQYTCMNTLVYADINNHQASMGATIVSTAQQLSITFGIAISSLIAGIFIPDRDHSTQAVIASGIHTTFFLLGGLTIFSALIFYRLKETDGETVSQHNVSPAP